MLNQEHWKPCGTYPPQPPTSTPSEIGILAISSPNTINLIAVQRQAPASMSARPWIKVQHGVT